MAAGVTGAAIGVQGHFWYGFIDRVIPRPTWTNAFKKVVLDQTIAAPIYTVTYILGKRMLIENFQFYSFCIL